MIEWVLVGKDKLGQIWPAIEKETKECLALGLASPNNNIDVVRSQVLKGDMLVALAYEGKTLRGSAVVKLVDHAGIKTAHAITVTGTGLANQQSADSFYRLWQEQGAKKILALCQPNTARLWSRVGFNTTHNIMEVNIWAE